MDATSMEIMGVLIDAPVNAATDLLLAVQCLAYYRHLSRIGGERSRCWGLFFQMMAVATAAGVVKHGFHHLLGLEAFTLVLATSNAASGFSIHSAQRATIMSRAAPARRSLFHLLTIVELIAFVMANLAVGPEITLLIVNTAVGLIPVIVVEACAFRRGSRAGGAIAGGLTLSIVTGLAYVGGFSLSPWFNHIDVAHLLMGVSFELVRRGARGVSAASPRRPPAPLASAIVPSLEEDPPWEP